MRKALLILVLLCFIGTPSLALGGGCNPEKSPTKVVVTLGGKEVAFCNLLQAYDAAFVKRPGAKADDLNNRVVPIKMRDYESGDMFNFYEGFYVIESDIRVDNAGDPPHILGFSSREKAWEWWEKNQKKIGGRVVNFETATREFRKAETGPSKKSLAKQAAAAGQLEKLFKKKK